MATFRYMFFPFCFLLTLLFTSAPSAIETVTITALRPDFRACRDTAGNVRIIIRQYRNNDVPFLLLVNPVTLESSTVRAADIDLTGNISIETVRNTPFIKALDRYTAPPYKLQNHGAVHAGHPVDGIFLTVDMCPSRRPFEKGFFTAVADLSRQSGRGTPVAIAITGNWLENHRDDLGWIVQQIKEGKLAVTWVNHSSTHPYVAGAPLERNFLLSPGIDFEREVLTTERLLLEKGLLPSPFFRFPGLVADEKLIRSLRELALIPIGSDAWLAKGETPKKGGFILVHGNGNEPQGIRKALQFLQNPGEVKLLPLNEAFSLQP